MKFYEVQQRSMYGWNRLGFFLNKKRAEEYEGEFNTTVMVNPTRIVEREFLDEPDEKDKRNMEI